MKPSVRTMNMKRTDFLQTSLSGNNLTASAPERTPTESKDMIYIQ